MLDAVAHAIFDLPVVGELVAHEAAVLLDERAVLLLLGAGDAVEGVLANVELAVELGEMDETSRRLGGEGILTVSCGIPWPMT